MLAFSKPVPANKADSPGGMVRLRFATAGKIADLRGTLKLVGEGRLKVTADAVAAAITSIGPNEFQVALQSRQNALVGIKLFVEPADADVKWQWRVDDSPWPSSAFFGGPLGVSLPKLSEGLKSADSDELVAAQLPYVSASRELGLFVAREQPLDSSVSLSESAQIEAQQAMQAWGYVRKPEVVKRGQRSPLQ